MRRTKIIATLGPASSALDQVGLLIQAGMDAARVNFSHGTREEHAAQIAAVRDAAARSGREIAVIQDLQGPKIRVGRMQGGAVELVEGGEVLLVPEGATLGTAEVLPISLLDLTEQAKSGDRVLLDDGRLRLRVLGAEGEAVRCRVEQGGRLTDHKGVNLPGVALRVESLTAKDLEDLAFGAAQGVDYVALSFVRTAADVRRLRSELERLGSRARIIAKIEKQEALEAIDEIVSVADAIMVARGDLGVEIPAEEVPHWQKDIIRRCVRMARPVITATQMLESMIGSQAPTRAEASDVANAVYDGTSAVMLSGETAVGEYPVEAVATMDRICRTTEEHLATGAFGLALREEGVAAGWGPLGAVPSGCPADGDPGQLGAADVTEAIAWAACHLAESLGAAAILTPTQTGATAREVASFRPSAPIVAAAADAIVRRQLALVWGVVPVAVEPAPDTDSTLHAAVRAGVAAGLIRTDDLVVLTCGARPNEPGSTNLIEVQRV